MNAFDFYRLWHKLRYQGNTAHRRYRVWFVDSVPITESELRAMWGDR